jgi:hypothetical protein
MFRKPTILVIGAGANFELGLPLGKELMNNVEATLRFDSHGNPKTNSADGFRDVLRNEFGKDYVDYAQAGTKLARVLNLLKRSASYACALR